jgi:hypothetical protein
MIRVLKQLGIEGTYMNIIKAIHNKPIANIWYQEWDKDVHSPHSYWM